MGILRLGFGLRLSYLASRREGRRSAGPALWRPSPPHHNVGRHRRMSTEGGASMLSRRGFVNGTIGTGIVFAAPGTQGASAQTPARKRMIVDAQVHLWTAETPE